MDMDSADGTRRGQRCPLCGQPTERAVRPFCSPRCKEIDLGRWLTGAYVIEGGRTDEDGEADEAAPEHRNATREIDRTREGD